MNSSHYESDTHALEARLAARLAGSLTAVAQAVPHDISERLRVAREQAVKRAGLARESALVLAPAVGFSAAGAAVLVGFGAWRQRFAVAMPLVVLIAGLVAIGHFTAREQVLTIADIDAQLLSDTLPPSAYSDPGFAEFLRTPPPLQ